MYMYDTHSNNISQLTERTPLFVSHHRVFITWGAMASKVGVCCALFCLPLYCDCMHLRYYPI
jgi:hypothetical protein